ncbi:MAG: sulfatase [Elusimicrobia bacterium]|nr:sulfatase [Elusimicrobiota bacterium]
MKSLVSVLLLLCAGSACRAADAAPAPDGYNVVMVLMETLRPDHLGCYGYSRATSPNMDKLAAEATVFENAYSQSSQSLVSAASVFTGLYPPSHGVTNVDQRLDPAVPTLAGELKRRGYRTAAFTSGFFLNRGFGLDSGFEEYDDSKDFGTLADVVPGALKWLRRNKAGKFFLLVHGYDAHAPYRAPKKFLNKFKAGYSGQLAGLPLDYNLSDRIWQDGLYEDFHLKKKVAALEKSDVDYIVSQYDGAVLYADSKIGELLGALEAQGLKEKTIVLLVSSAGEALMDHGTIISSFHGGLYDEGIHVPLLVRAPGSAPSRVKAAVQLVDVMPTVLELLGFSSTATLQGVSLKPAMGGKAPPDRTVYAQTLSLRTGAPYVGIRKYPWKLFLEDGSYELYDLAGDPAEQLNAASGNPAVLKAMKAELDRVVKAMPRRKTADRGRPLAAVAGRMKELGYWWVIRPRADYWAEQGRKKAGER